jgi:hypothetical protein
VRDLEEAFAAARISAGEKDVMVHGAGLAQKAA